jgi:transcriptional regulator with XRE-family HTH domain
MVNMAFYERLSEVCREKNTTPTTIAKSLGIATSAPVKWKTGTIPNGETLAKIADYLNVSVDYLLGRSEDKKIRPTEDIDESDLSEREQYLLMLLRKVPDRDRPTVDRMIQALVQDEQ